MGYWQFLRVIETIMHVFFNKYRRRKRKIVFNFFKVHPKMSIIRGVSLVIFPKMRDARHETGPKREISRDTRRETRDESQPCFRPISHNCR
jgi:hypothetical protein